MTNSLLKRLGGFVFKFSIVLKNWISIFFEGDPNILTDSGYKTPRLCCFFFGFLLILGIRNQGKPVQNPYSPVVTRENPKMYPSKPGFQPAKTHTNPKLWKSRFCRDPCTTRTYPIISHPQPIITHNQNLVFSTWPKCLFLGSDSLLVLT